MKIGPYNTISDAEHQLCHLSMTDTKHVNKYVVEFHHITCQVHGYGDGALQQLFYQGLPDHIKAEISYIGKPSTLSDMQTLMQLIDVHY